MRYGNDGPGLTSASARKGGSGADERVPQASAQPNTLSGGLLQDFPLRFWLVVVLTGIGAGLGGGLLMMLLRTVQQIFWNSSPDEFVAGVQKTGWAWRIAVVGLAGLVVPAVRWLLKQAHGAHGGELTVAIWFHAGRLAPLPALTNAITSMIEVGLGSALGRESAPKQIGALVASMASLWTGLPAGQRRLLTACGAGAGMAAVYNVPLGGALFALEVLLGTVSLSLIVPAMATSLIATAVSWLMLPDKPTYHLPAYPLSSAQIVWAILAAPLLGFASVAYVRMIVWADEHKPSGRMLVIVPVLVFAGLGCLAIPFPQLLGNGKDVVQAALLDQYGVKLLLILTVLRPIATSACLGSGAPGGLFTPTMTFGAVLGAALGHGWALIWPGAPFGSYALLGSGAVLAATTQGPVSAIVLVLELTGRLDTMMVPMMIVIAGAVLVARRFESRSVYSGRIHTARMSAAAADRAGPEGVQVISAATRYPELLQALLRQASHPGILRVVDESGQAVGTVQQQRAMAPTPSLFPLETATAEDFARND